MRVPSLRSSVLTGLPILIALLGCHTSGGGSELASFADPPDAEPQRAPSPPARAPSPPARAPEPGAPVTPPPSARPAHSSSAGPVRGISAGDEMVRLANIPQQRNVLGDPLAPITLVVLADLQSRRGRVFAVEVLPTLVERHVRSGQLRLVFEPVANRSRGSRAAARMALALGQQGHMFEFVDLFYLNLPRLVDDELTDEVLRGLAVSIPGVDVLRALEDRDMNEVAKELDEADRLARTYDVRQTPAFLLGLTMHPLVRLRVPSLTEDAFARAIDAVVKDAGSD